MSERSIVVKVCYIDESFSGDGGLHDESTETHKFSYGAGAATLWEDALHDICLDEEDLAVRGESRTYQGAEARWPLENGQTLVMNAFTSAGGGATTKMEVIDDDEDE